MWHTHKRKCARANRVKLCKRTTRKLRATKNVFKVERCGSSLLTSNSCCFLIEIASEKCCESCSQWSVHCENLKQKSLTKAGERATSARDCWRVNVGVSVQQYSVQCKGYNLIGVTTLEAIETRGTTALVYWLINSSLYTGTVHVLSSVLEYTQLVWPPTRGIGRCPH
jgi:hypothetical protein